jgi:hypothetical protein
VTLGGVSAPSIARPISTGSSGCDRRVIGRRSRGRLPSALALRLSR